ncbi:MAG: accessory factor UbiK family protein [Alphaproteobacteria bacterium]
MQFDNRVLDDIARVTGGAMGALARIKEEVETIVRQQIERAMGGLELVTREEFEAVREMAAKARSEQEDLAARLERLEQAAAAEKRKRPHKPGSEHESKPE